MDDKTPRDFCIFSLAAELGLSEFIEDELTENFDTEILKPTRLSSFKNDKDYSELT